MKRILLIMCFCFLFMTATNAAELNPNRIFGNSIGLSGSVTANLVNVRAYPSINANIVTQVEDNDSIKIIGKNNDWYQINHDNDTAWIHEAFVEVGNVDLIPKVLANGEEVIQYGLTFIGTPYIWGGNNLTIGVDCSGFIQQLYDTFDIEISRVSYQQADDGETISKDELQTGDVSGV